MRPPPLPASEYERRIARVQEELAAERLDALVGYSSECESATCRYLAGFWPFFDFACVVVPASGRAVLVTGGPESLEFARSFSPVADVVVNPLLVETSAPEWVPMVEGESFRTLLPRICGTPLRRIGVANWNIVPHVVLEDVRTAAPSAELVPADDVLNRVQRIKSEAEVPLIVEAYRITEEAMKAALEAARPGGARMGAGSRGPRLHGRCRRRRHVVPGVGLLGSEHAAEPLPVDGTGRPNERAGPMHVRSEARRVLR